MYISTFNLIAKLEIDMYCYRGIKYNAQDLKKQVKKSKKSDTVTYRGITGKLAA